jgi:hypothetical protein
MKAEIARFFDMFVKAFSSFKGGDIANLYHVPGIALRGDGSIYYTEGARACRFRDLDVMPLGGRSALATVTWELLRDDASAVRVWRQSYNLVRTNGRWQVFASTFHQEGT